jgi:dihydroorotate dehydrogenase
LTGLYALLRPALRALDPETAHRLAVVALKRGLVPGRPPVGLPVDVLWLRFPNPVGLAAGFDKHAEAPDALIRLGFGFVEVGSVTPRPQGGNPKPRVFRLDADRAVINRYGFNSEGLEAVARRLAARHGRGGIVGANLGANKDSPDPVSDYVAGLDRLHGLADYFVINVSSPNTPGLRALQARESLSQLLDAVLDTRARRTAPGARPVPLLLKIAPDLDSGERRAIAEVAVARGIDGMIVSNTTLARPELRDAARGESGGLSGAPLFAPSTALLAEMYRLTEGRLVLVGVGGVGSGRDAYTKIRAGASLVQVYTALVFDGPGLVVRIGRELAALLRADGFVSVADAVGADVRSG